MLRSGYEDRAFRLQNLLPYDSHAGENGQYAIRSLYFDDYDDSCLRENEAGVDNRRKYRIRLYNGSADRLQLEIKRKRHGMTQKLSCLLTREQCEVSLMRGRCPPFLEPLDPRLRKEYWGVSAARPRKEQKEAEAARPLRRRSGRPPGGRRRCASCA